MSSPVVNHPKPDFKGTLKVLTGMAVALVFLHWVPDIATWVHAHYYGEQLVIDPKRYRAVLGVAYVMGGIAVTVNLAGLIWAIWHNRKRGH
jgi:hypothetical protein